MSVHLHGLRLDTKKCSVFGRHARGINGQLNKISCNDCDYRQLVFLWAVECHSIDIRCRTFLQSETGSVYTDSHFCLEKWR
ncbi:hypothetical protein ScPMuIL_017927 [Solemya velum]